MNILALCDNEKEIEKVQKSIETTDCVLLFSKNRKLCLALRAQNKEISFLETSEKLYNIADDVWDVIDTINKYVKQNICADERDLHLYELSYHIEGGYEQVLLNLILDIRYINEIIEKHDIGKVFFSKQRGYESEGAAIEIICHTKGIGVTGLQNAFSRIKLNMQKVRKKVSTITEVQFLLKLLKAVKIMGLHAVQEQDYIKDDNVMNIGLIKLTAREKVLNWSRPILNEISRRSFNYEIICRNRKDADFWQNNGFKADYFERYLKFIDILKEYWNYYTRIKRIKKNKANLSINYWGYDISKICYATLIDTLLYSTSEMIRYNCAAKYYFKNKKFDVMIMNGNTNFVVNRICYYSNKEYHKSTLFIEEPGDMPPIKGAYYEPYKFMQDIAFGVPVPSLSMKKKRHVSKVDFSFYAIESTIFSEKKRSKKDEKIKASPLLELLWAPSYPLKGLSDYGAFISCNDEILSAICDKACKLHVKFHPNQNEDEIEYIIRPYRNSKNIEFTDKDVNIYDMFEKVQLVVTDPSTVMLEAAAIGIPVICIALDAMFDSVSFYKEGLWIFDSIKDAIDLILKLIRDKDYFEDWRGLTIKRQDEFFSPFVGNGKKLDFVLDTLEKSVREIKGA